MRGTFLLLLVLYLIFASGKVPSSAKTQIANALIAVNDYFVPSQVSARFPKGKKDLEVSFFQVQCTYSHVHIFCLYGDSLVLFPLSLNAGAGAAVFQSRRPPDLPRDKVTSRHRHILAYVLFADACYCNAV
jgi:hypothetical protein